MSHHMNDLVYEQHQDLYWDTFNRLIDEGYPYDWAEDLALVAVERAIEEKGDI